MYCLVHSFELGLNWGGGVCKCLKKLWGLGPQAPMHGTPMGWVQNNAKLNEKAQEN